MKKSDVKVGEVYRVKVSGTMADVRLTGENPHGGWDGLNVRTNRAVRIKSAQRLRAKAPAPEADKVTAKRIVSKEEYEAQARREHARATHKADPASPKATPRQAQENARLAEERAKAPHGRTASERAMSESAPSAKKGTKAAKAAKAGGKRDTGQPRGQGGKKTSGLDAAAQVLADARKPLSAKEMVERMLDKGLWTTGGKTPHATIYAAIIREIATKGDEARFRKVDRGQFELAR